MSQAMELPRDIPPSATTHTGERQIRVEDRFRLLAEGVGDYAIFMLDPDGMVSTWNSGAERIKGYHVLEILGRHFSLFYPPQARIDGLPERMLRTAAAEGRCTDEGWRLRKDGSAFWASIVITALRDANGGLLGFGKVTRDLTERRAAEEALRLSSQQQTRIAAELAEANAYLKNIFNASTLVAIIATGLDGVITLFNRGAERMLGYAAEEIVGLHTPSLLHLPQEVESRGHELTTLLNRPVEGFDVFVTCIGRTGFDHLDWTYVRKDGSHLIVTLSVSAVVDEAGLPIGYLGVAEDVTERRNAAHSIAAAYTQLHAVLECTSDCVMTVGRDWNILYGNQRTIVTLPDFAVGRGFWECFPSVLGSPSETILRSSMKARIDASYEHFSVPYGVWFKVRVFPSEVGISLFFTDVTTEKRMEEQIALEQVLREKRIEALSHMAGGLAHEISNPLAIIHARACDLQTALQAGEEISRDDLTKASDSIVQTADRAIRILRGLRGFAREAGNDPMEWATLEGIVDRCLEMQEARFERHGIALRVELPPGLPHVLCRETQICQILTNLVNNAFDAIDQSSVPERVVTIRAHRDGETVVIQVIDSGPGIEEQFRPHLMDPFFSTKTGGLGMGVGLSLSRAIAQEHGGSLSLCPESERTCFQLILPIEPAQRSNVTPEKAV